MGVEIISNAVAAYKEVPSEAIPGHNSAKVISLKDHAPSNGTQAIAQTETSAVNQAETDAYRNGANDYKEEEKEKERMIKSAVKEANNKIEISKTHCEFSYHEKTKRVSITVKDDVTGDVIREIPPKETLDMLGKMWEMAGLFVDNKG